MVVLYISTDSEIDTLSGDISRFYNVKVNRKLYDKSRFT
jgi:hypothetical protein